MGYISEAMTRKQIRELAMQIRENTGLTNQLYFPIIQYLEGAMPIMYGGFYYTFVPKGYFLPNIHGDTDVIKKRITLSEDVYAKAIDDSGRDRMTVAHEFGHYHIMVVCGVKFCRNFGEEKPVPYRDPEWQAKAFAGELLIPYHLTKNMSAWEIMHTCKVSEDAAQYRLRI